MIHGAQNAVKDHSQGIQAKHGTKPIYLLQKGKSILKMELFKLVNNNIHDLELNYYSKKYISLESKHLETAEET